MLNGMRRDITRPPRARLQSVLGLIGIALAVGTVVGGLALVALAVVVVVGLNQLGNNK
jgi:hypothetical protein